VTTGLKKAFAMGAADKALRELGMAAVEDRVVEVVEGQAQERSGASEEVAEIEHTVGMAHTVAAWEHCDIAEAKVAGSSSRRRVACRYCTSAVDTADADADCRASSYPHLAACLALPADDDRSSCRLGRLSFQADRVLDRIGAARCR
jgi:hypothetical protein